MEIQPHYLSDAGLWLGKSMQPCKSPLASACQMGVQGPARSCMQCMHAHAHSASVTGKDLASHVSGMSVCVFHTRPLSAAVKSPVTAA